MDSWHLKQSLKQFLGSVGAKQRKQRKEARKGCPIIQYLPLSRVSPFPRFLLASGSPPASSVPQWRKHVASGRSASFSPPRLSCMAEYPATRPSSLSLYSCFRLFPLLQSIASKQTDRDKDAPSHPLPDRPGVCPVFLPLSWTSQCSPRRRG